MAARIFKKKIVMNNDEIIDALNYDAISEAEKKSGVSYKESDAVGWMALRDLLSRNREKREMQNQANDTTFGMSMESYLDNLKDFGFEIIYSKEFPSDNCEKDIHYILFHKEYGVLVNTDTYGVSRNSATAVFNFKITGVENWNNLRHVGLSGCIDCHTSFDARESIRLKINSCLQNGKFTKEWDKKPSLWLLNHKDSGNNHKEISKNIISQFPDDIKVMIENAL
jgi:hypothetical protein